MGNKTGISKQDFEQGLMLLGTCFSKQLTIPLIETYYRKLEHLNSTEFFVIVDRCINELKFFPTVKELLDMAPNRNQAPALENKGALSYCDNTKRLKQIYGPGTKWQQGAACE